MFRDGKKATQEEDRNGDGKIDARYTFDAEERVAVEELLGPAMERLARFLSAGA